YTPTGKWELPHWKVQATPRLPGGTRDGGPISDGLAPRDRFRIANALCNPWTYAGVAWRLRVDTAAPPLLHSATVKSALQQRLSPSRSHPLLTRRRPRASQPGP